MELALLDPNWKDNVLGFCHSFQDHIQGLTEVFNHFFSAGLQLKASECQFGRTQVTVLGHVPNHGLQPDVRNFEKGRKRPPPRWPPLTTLDSSKLFCHCSSIAHFHAQAQYSIYFTYFRSLNL